VVALLLVELALATLAQVASGSHWISTGSFTAPSLSPSPSPRKAITVFDPRESSPGPNPFKRGPFICSVHHSKTPSLADRQTGKHKQNSIKNLKHYLPRPAQCAVPPSTTVPRSPKAPSLGTLGHSRPTALEPKRLEPSLLVGPRRKPIRFPGDCTIALA
jgi:hypothetical protein